jgi:hypothetical protein
MQIDLLSIPLLTAYNSRNNDELVLGDEVTDASLVSTAVARGGGKVEFQGRGDLDDEKEKTEDGPHIESGGAHGWL